MRIDIVSVNRVTRWVYKNVVGGMKRRKSIRQTPVVTSACMWALFLSSALPFCLLGSDDAKEVVLFLFEAWSFNKNDK